MQLHKLIHNLAQCDLDRTPYVADWKALARADFDLETALIAIAASQDKKYPAYVQVKFAGFGTDMYNSAIGIAKRALGVL